MLAYLIDGPADLTKMHIKEKSPYIVVPVIPENCGSIVPMLEDNRPIEEITCGIAYYKYFGTLSNGSMIYVFSTKQT